MYYVYVLWSSCEEKFYIGYTADLKRRMVEHRARRVHTTCRFSDFSLIFYEAFVADEDARRRERYFKTNKGKKSLRLMVRRSIGDTRIKVVV